MKLINADKLMEVMMATCLKETMDVGGPIEGMSIVLDRIYNAPTVNAAKVVRCEDCNKSNEWVNGRWCQRFCTPVNTDSYCSFGEKRKERRKNETN